MRIATRLTLIAVIALAGRATSLTAQNAGFQIGIARPTPGFPPTQAPAVAVRGGTFVGNGGYFTVPAGTVIWPGQQFIGPGQQFAFPGGQFPIPNWQFAAPNQVVIPNQVFVPAQQLLLPGQTFIPQPVFTPGTTIVDPAVRVPGGQFGHPVPTRPLQPPIGTPRAHVIRQLGYPTVSVITSRSEILQFNGGVTVVIENGHVVRPR